MTIIQSRQLLIIKTKMSDKLQKIVDHITELSVLEVAELVKALEEKFGVTASPVAIAAAPQSASDGAPVEEKTEFTVILKAAGCPMTMELSGAIM